MLAWFGYSLPNVLANLVSFHLRHEIQQISRLPSLISDFPGLNCCINWMEWIIEFVWLKTFNPTNEINSIPFQFQQHSNNPGNKYYNIWIMADFTTCILTLACLYIIYANQQITLILNFYSIVVLLFLNFFSINDIYLLSFFIGLIYSGALVISFLFVLMIIDLNVFNLRNNLIFIWFGFFMNQQCYNSFNFLMIHFSLSFLFNLRKIKQY